MASSSSSILNFFTLTLILTLSLSSTSASRVNGSTLAARLKVAGGGGGGDESSKCWESLFELQACAGEVVSFFVNGEAYLGSSCCRAIRVVGHDCWPNLMGSLGFTPNEADALLGYCDDDEGEEKEGN